MLLHLAGTPSGKKGQNAGDLAGSPASLTPAACCMAGRKNLHPGAAQLSEKQKYRLGGEWMESSPEVKDLLRSSAGPSHVRLQPRKSPCAGVFPDPTVWAAGKGGILPLWPAQV